MMKWKRRSKKRVEESFWLIANWNYWFHMEWTWCDPFSWDCVSYCPRRPLMQCEENQNRLERRRRREEWDFRLFQVQSRYFFFSLFISLLTFLSRINSLSPYDIDGCFIPMNLKYCVAASNRVEMCIQNSKINVEDWKSLHDGRSSPSDWNKKTIFHSITPESF